LLALNDLDTVEIATPDHWHALQVLDAAKLRAEAPCPDDSARALDERCRAESGHHVVNGKPAPFGPTQPLGL